MWGSEVIKGRYAAGGINIKLIPLVGFGCGRSLESSVKTRELEGAQVQEAQRADGSNSLQEAQH